MAYAMFIMYPVSLHPLTSMVGQAYDNYQHLWSMWWFRYSLTELFTHPNNLTILFAPLGMYNPIIFASPLPHLYSIPFQYLLGAIGTYNIFLLASFPLCGMAMYALAFDLTKAHLPAFVAGFVFAFFPAKTIHMLGHYLQFHIYWLPLYVMFLLRLLSSPCLKNAILTGVFLALSTLSHMIHAAYFVVPITLIILLYYLVKHKRLLFTSKTLCYLVSAFLVGIVIMLPFYLPYLVHHSEGGFKIEPGDSVYVPDLFSFVVPQIYHPLARWIPGLPKYILQLVPKGSGAVESTAYFGVLVFVLAIVGVVKQKHKTALWAVVCAVGAVLSLGSLLHVNGKLVTAVVDNRQVPILLPYYLFDRLPFIGAGRTPGRLSTLAMFGMAMLAAFGAGAVSQWLRKAWLRTGTIMCLVVILAFDYSIYPMPYHTIPSVPFFEDLEKRETGAVMNYPGFHKSASSVGPGLNYGMIDQITHHKPVNSGYIWRWDKELANATLALDELVMPGRDAEIFDYPADNDVAAMLRQQSYEYIVIRKPISDEMDPSVRSQARAYWRSLAGDERELLPAYQSLLAKWGTPEYEDTGLWAFRIPESSTESNDSYYIRAGAGDWGGVYLDTGYPRRVLKHEGELVIERLTNSRARLVFTAATSDGFDLAVIVDGIVKDYFTVPPNQDFTIVTRYLDLRQGSNSIWLRATRQNDKPADFWISQVSLQPEDPSIPAAQAIFASGMRLESVSIPTQKVKPGDTLPVTMTWRTHNTITRDYTVFVHLTGEDRQPLAQHDSQPAQAARPVSSWQVGEYIKDVHPINIPNDLPPGKYELWAGVYSFIGADVVNDSIDASMLPTNEHCVQIGTVEIAAVR